MTNSQFNTILVRLMEVADPEKASQMAAYMKNRFEFLGVQTPTRRDVSKAFLATLAKEKEIDWDFIEAAYQAPYRECHYVALDYLKKVQKRLVFEDLPRLLSLAQRHQWWDSIDVLDRVMGNIGLRDTRVNQWMLDLSQSEDFWLRRIAIDHQIGRKLATNPDLLRAIILHNLGSKEFFINKAIGWSLREYAKVNPVWVQDFVDEHENQLSNLSKREALKHLK